MKRAVVEQLDLVAGGSPELSATLQTVADTEAFGTPKFSERVSRKLAQTVVCRAYAPAMHELCHLITVAEACAKSPRRYEAFFWDSGPASTAGFRAYIDRELFGQAEAAPRVSADRVKVEIAYADGGFAITYARMPFLSAMVEFLMTALGYGALDEVWQEMLSRGPTAAAVSDAANALSRQVYDYLKDHLVSTQYHRKFSVLVAYLAQLGEGDFGPATVDDPAVLDFWLSRSDDGVSDGLDFRTFASVFLAFVRLRQVLEEARDFQALESAKPIGPDREAGEVDPGSVSALVEAIDEAESPLVALQSAPAASVKFLNKTEIADLEKLVGCGKSSLALPLSLLRCEIFGAAQARLSQAQRRKATSEELRDLIATCEPHDYGDHRNRLDRLERHLERVLLASLDVLAVARRPEAVSLIRALRQDIDLSPLGQILIGRDEDDKVVRLDGEGYRDRLIAALSDPQIVGPELAALMTEARKAFKGLSRQGFGQGETSRPEAGEAFATGVESLIEIRRRLTAFRQKLQQMSLPKGDWAGQFAADSDVFRKQFILLYGVAA